MTIYHIGKSGKPSICRAKAGNCPLGGTGDHFDSKEACQEHINKQAEQNFGMTGGVEDKTAKEPDSPNVAKAKEMVANKDLHSGNFYYFVTDKWINDNDKIIAVPGFLERMNGRQRFDAMLICFGHGKDVPKELLDKFPLEEKDGAYSIEKMSRLIGSDKDGRNKVKEYYEEKFREVHSKFDDTLDLSDSRNLRSNMLLLSEEVQQEVIEKAPKTAGGRFLRIKKLADSGEISKSAMFKKQGDGYRCFSSSFSDWMATDNILGDLYGGVEIEATIFKVNKELMEKHNLDRRDLFEYYSSFYKTNRTMDYNEGAGLLYVAKPVRRKRR